MSGVTTNLQNAFGGTKLHMISQNTLNSEHSFDTEALNWGKI